MTFEELLNESVDICKKAFEKEKAELASDAKKAKAVKAEIKNVSEEIEEKLKTVVEEIDSKTKAYLLDLIETGKGILGIEYDSFEEMLVKLANIRTMHVLNKEISKCEKDLKVYSYEYAADQPRFKTYEKSCNGTLYVLESKKEKADAAVLFTNEAITFVKFKTGGIFQLSDKLKVPYENIIGVCQGYDSKADDEYIDIILGTTEDASTWEHNSFELGSIDDEIVCDIMDKIICTRRTLNTEDDIAKYYSDCCRLVYELPFHEIKVSLAEQWKIITVLGEKAHQIKEDFCKDILLTVYQRQKNRAALDKNKELESFSRRRILILTDSIEEQDKRKVRINNKRQITIPEQMYEAMDFKDEAELVYENGRLYINPSVTEESNTASEILLEELVSMGLTGDDLLKYFRLGVSPEEDEILSDDDEIEEPTPEPQKTKRTTERKASEKKTLIKKTEKTEKSAKPQKEKKPARKTKSEKTVELNEYGDNPNTVY